MSWTFFLGCFIKTLKTEQKNRFSGPICFQQLSSRQTAMWARAKNDTRRRRLGWFCSPLLGPEPVRRIIYAAIRTALSTLCRTITTNTLISVTTQLTTTVLGNVVVPPSAIPKVQSSTRKAQ
jgi:hypothetical protein